MEWYWHTVWEASRLPGWFIWFSHRRPVSCWCNSHINNSDKHKSCFWSELRWKHVWNEREEVKCSLGPAALLLCELEPNTMSPQGLYFLVDPHPVSLTPTLTVFFLSLSQSSSCTSKGVCSSWEVVWPRYASGLVSCLDYRAFLVKCSNNEYLTLYCWVKAQGSLLFEWMNRCLQFRDHLS